MMKNFFVVIVATLALLVTGSGCGGPAFPSYTSGNSNFCDFGTFEYNANAHKAIQGWWDPFPQGGAAYFAVEADWARFPPPYDYAQGEHVLTVVAEWHPDGRNTGTNVSCTNVQPDVIQQNPTHYFQVGVLGRGHNYPFSTDLVHDGYLEWDADDWSGNNANGNGGYDFKSYDGLSWVTTLGVCVNCSKNFPTMPSPK